MSTTLWGGRPNINSQLIGKRVKVTGVSGEFRDKLLLLRRNTPMKFRSGRYFADTNSLVFWLQISWCSRRPLHLIQQTMAFPRTNFVDSLAC